MPQLTREAATKAANKAEKLDANGFPQLDVGFYLFRLMSVTEKDSAAGNPVWMWKFEELNEEIGVVLFTTMNDANIGRAGKVFEAFGVPADTNTDLLCGKIVAGTVVSQKDNRDGIFKPSLSNVVPASQHPDYKGAGAGAAKSTSDYGLSDEATVQPKLSGADEPF